MKIKPNCIIHKNYFVEINGMFLPCCHIGSNVQSMQRLKEIYGEQYPELFLQNNSPEKIISLWSKIADTWTSDRPLEICTTICNDKNWDTVFESNT